MHQPNCLLIPMCIWALATFRYTSSTPPTPSAQEGGNTHTHTHRAWQPAALATWSGINMGDLLPPPLVPSCQPWLLLLGSGSSFSTPSSQPPPSSAVNVSSVSALKSLRGAPSKHKSWHINSRRTEMKAIRCVCYTCWASQTIESSIVYLHTAL